MHPPCKYVVIHTGLVWPLAADGVLHGSEVVAVRRVFDALEVPHDVLYRLLEANLPPQTRWVRLPDQQIIGHSTSIDRPADHLPSLDTSVDAETKDLLRAFDEALF